MSCANSGPPRAEAAARAVRRTAFIYIIHTRQQRTAAERISEKGRSRRRSVKNRRLFDPQKCEASDLAQSRDRPRNRFTAAAFRLPFGRAKGNVCLFLLERFLSLEMPILALRLGDMTFIFGNYFHISEKCHIFVLANTT